MDEDIGEVVTEEELHELIGRLLQILEGRSARLGGAALSAAIAIVGYSINMPKHKVMAAAVGSINEAWTDIEERQKELNGQENR